MQFKVLGSAAAVRDDGESVDLGPRKPRSVVAALALSPGRPLPADAVADLVWGGEPPRAAHGALHAYLSNLRRSLDPGRSRRDQGSVIETTDHGYVLRVAARDVDAHHYAAEVRDCERSLAPLSSQIEGRAPQGWPGAATVSGLVERLDVVMATWRGEPYADLPDHPTVLAARSSLERVREAAEETRLLGLLALQEHSVVLAATEQMTAAFPTRERLWALHALALTRAGRQADALDALRACRRVLQDELGLDPGSALRALEEAILRQSPALDAVVGPATRPSPRPSTGPGATSGATGSTPARSPRDAPVLGRDAEREALGQLVEGAVSGRLSLAQVVGEPGIGKSRLVEDLVAVAREREVTVAVGRCSQDDGAPPLWPWHGVLSALASADDLGRDPDPAGPSGPSPEQVAFETSERVVQALVGHARRHPLLVVLEDLHWSDEVSLRVLAHLAAAVPDDAPLAVVATRRQHPEPTGQLAATSEAFARRSALRLDLGGLDPDAAGALLRWVAGDDVPAADATAWHERAAGNPFFLQELARLGVDRAGGEVPVTVREVVARHVATVSGDALRTLEVASVVGRRFGLAVVGAALGRDPDVAADDLEECLAAGLLVEEGVEEYAFTHALTRDAVLASLSAGRAARLHARVAQVLETDERVRLLHAPTELVADLARHWLAAGPSATDRAWPAARAAASQARALTAYQEAVRLRRSAVEAHRRSVSASAETRYDLLLELATDAAYAGDWPSVEAASLEGMALGRELDAPARVAEAASALTRYCVWLPHEPSFVPEDAVEDLRWALHHVDPDDTVARCRLHLALAVELYPVADASAETAALVETGLDLARSSGDPSLVWWACRAAWMAWWNPDATDRRVALAQEGLAAAGEWGDPAALAVSHVTAAIDQLELGHRAAWEAHAEAASAIARRERLPYVMLTWHWLNMSLATMQGDQELAEVHLAGIAETAPRTAVPLRELQEAAAAAMVRLWQGSLEHVAELMALAAEAQPMGVMPALGVLARAGLEERLRGLLLSSPPSDEMTTPWSVLADWCFVAEAAAVVGDAALAREAAVRLAPYDDRIAVSGAALPLGPLAGYLALAEATLGDLPGARFHADAATVAAEAFGLVAYLDWLGEQRARLGF